MLKPASQCLDILFKLRTLKALSVLSHSSFIFEIDLMHVVSNSIISLFLGENIEGIASDDDSSVKVKLKLKSPKGNGNGNRISSNRRKRSKKYISDEEDEVESEPQ